jgi:tetratricopeptide (TPR) repeat protein
MRWNQLARHIGLSFAATAVFLLAAEGVFRVAGVPTLRDEADPFLGFSRRVRVFQEDAGRGIFRTHPAAVRHTFRSQEFLIHKPPGGLRVFVLGGSSAYGFPHAEAEAFPAILERVLRAAHPERVVEVVNAAAMSYGSHRQRVLAHELLEHEPDVLILYEAHNEFVEERFYRDIITRPAALDPLRAALHGTRLYSAMTFGYRRFTGPRPHSRFSETGADGLLGLDVAREDASLRRAQDKDAALDRFRANIGAIFDLARSRGALAIVCTVAANLRAWPPNQSLFDPATPAASRQEALALERSARQALANGDPARADEALARAVGLAPGHAGLQFLRGQALEALSRWDEARTAYRKAADEDVQPARALSVFNDAIRGLAKQHSSVLVDVERRFEEISPHGLVGFDLIEDYVHPTPEGHAIIAWELWRAIEEAGMAGGASAPDRELFARAAAVRGPGESGDMTADRLFNMAVVLEHQGLPERAMDAYRRCLAANPSHIMAAYNLGRLLHTSRRPDLAEPVFRAALGIDPGHVPSRVGRGLCLIGLDRLPEALDELRSASEADPFSAPAWKGLGSALGLQGDYHAARDAFRRAVSLQPGDAQARAWLGSMLRVTGDLDGAIATLREAIALRHDVPHARGDLADALRARGDRVEAASLYREILRDDPADARARAGLEAIETRDPDR